MSQHHDLPQPLHPGTGWPWSAEIAAPVAGPWPRVSIVMPSFNQADFLEEALLSLLHQGYPDLEIIVMDGGSTDGSVDVLKYYAPWLTAWSSARDGGQADAINRGLAQATGAVFGWLNSDDTLLPGALFSAVSALRADERLEVVYGDVRFTAADGRYLNRMESWAFDLKSLICATNLLPQPSTFFRRRAWEKVGGLDESLRLCLDYDLWLRMALAGSGFWHVPGDWSTYRLHDASKTESQALRFADEMDRVVRAAFDAGTAPPAWRAEAESNLAQYRAEALLRQGRDAEARRWFWKAVRAFPWRAKALAQAGFAIDRRLGFGLRDLRWRLAGRGAAWRMPDAHPSAANGRPA